MSLATVTERTTAKPAAVRATISMKLCETRPSGGSAAVSCSKCCLAHVCLPHGLAQSALSDMDELTRVKRRVAKGATLYRTGDAFESLYAVRSGSFKTVGVSRHGDEKVTGLHLPGEVMGLEAINTKRQGYDAIALEDSEVCVVPFAALSNLSMRIPELQQQLLRILSGDISRDQGLMLLLGGMHAEQRLAAFLLSLSRRYQKLGYASTRFSLRMTREEIGSYLGLTLETVSRLFSRFQKDGLLKAHQKEIELENVERLREKVGN
jgi:CRP/FNR family transcriptional regulator, anaerobic regulatory protein